MRTQPAPVSLAARPIKVDQIKPAHARMLAGLTEAVSDLAGLAAGLTRRGRQTTATVRYTDEEKSGWDMQPGLDL